MTAFQAALKYAVLSTFSPRKAPSFARVFEATTDEATFGEYLDFIWGKAAH